MQNETGQSWSHSDFKFYGHSLAGTRTAITIPELRISFDVSQGYPFLMPMLKFFMTHGHLDHAAGIPYIISQKMLISKDTPDFYMPSSLVSPMTEIMKLWSSIEGFTYRYNFIPIFGGEEIEINNQFYVKPFRTIHRIESFGYTVFEKKKKLKPAYTHLSQQEIIAHRTRGEDINDFIHTPVVSFTGDTQIEFLDSQPWVKKSKILFVEATFLDDQRSIQQARDWGHIHIDEIVARLPEIESEKIVIIHSSSRYSDQYALDCLKKKLPADFCNKVVLFPGR